MENNETLEQPSPLQNVATVTTPAPLSFNPLIPEGIEKFVPSCVVCKAPVPKKRATSRSKDTCSKECQAVLRAYRKFNIESRYCPSCYHPSTPEERKEFRLWRKHRGDLRERPGRPPVKKAEAAIPEMKTWKFRVGREWDGTEFAQEVISDSLDNALMTLLQSFRNFQDLYPNHTFKIIGEPELISGVEAASV